jgi:hypothetical protein
MGEFSTCWHADHTDRWRLIAGLSKEGWVAVVYDREQKTDAYRELALDVNDAKAKARYFLVGVAPPITFHKGSSIELQWTPCRENVRDSV